jgi:hypothetical protein
MRTQNPPPLKACRFDSDLGHHCAIVYKNDLRATVPAPHSGVFKEFPDAPYPSQVSASVADEEPEPVIHS